MSDNYIIAIDGPTASGKGTVAKLLSQKLNIPCLSTGSIYRAITVYYLDHNVSSDDIEQIERTINRIDIDVKCDQCGNTIVHIDGKDVTERLHDFSVSDAVHCYGRIPCIRKRAAYFQKLIASRNSIICEGRDITSVIFPNARYKFYLTAGLVVRANRRYKQEVKKDATTTFYDVIRSIWRRDTADMSRELSPLVCVKDAKVINSNALSIDQVVDSMLSYIHD